MIFWEKQWINNSYLSSNYHYKFHSSHQDSTKPLYQPILKYDKNDSPVYWLYFPENYALSLTLNKDFRRSAELWLLYGLIYKYTSKLNVINAVYGCAKKKINITKKLNNMILFDKLYINSNSNLLTLLGIDPCKGEQKKIEITYSEDGKSTKYLEIEERGNKLKKSLIIHGEGYNIQMKCYHKSNVSHYTQRYQEKNYK